MKPSRTAILSALLNATSVSSAAREVGLRTSVTLHDIARRDPEIAAAIAATVERWRLEHAGEREGRRFLLDALDLVHVLDADQVPLTFDRWRARVRPELSRESASTRWTRLRAGLRELGLVVAEPERDAILLPRRAVIERQLDATAPALAPDEEELREAAA